MDGDVDVDDDDDDDDDDDGYLFLFLTAITSIMSCISRSPMRLAGGIIRNQQIGPLPNSHAHLAPSSANCATNILRKQHG